MRRHNGLSASHRAMASSQLELVISHSSRPFGVLSTYRGEIVVASPLLSGGVVVMAAESGADKTDVPTNAYEKRTVQSRRVVGKFLKAPPK